LPLAFGSGAYLIHGSKIKIAKAHAALASRGPQRIPVGAEQRDPFNSVARELDLVEQTLARAIGSKEQSLTDIAAHLIDGGGKRVRPMVTLLAHLALGGKGTQDIVDIATAIELIHTATLLHDDIIDCADTRRGKVSAYKKFGLKSTLVAGDFLFIKAFEFAGKFDENVVQWTADACTLLTEGEILQGYFNRNRAVTLGDYIEIVKRKTASLFQTGCKVGAYLAGATPAIMDDAEHYGLSMGIAFQIVDDVLDVVGHADLLGKPIGMDLRDGNPSLPIILALDDPGVREAFERSECDESVIAGALDTIKRGPGIEEAKKLSRQYAESALTSLEKLPPSAYRKGLKALVRLIIDREF
jgi:geranylgeranyl pyrophosphate synthase